MSNKKIGLLLLAAFLFCPLIGQAAPSSPRIDSVMENPPPEPTPPAAAKPPEAKPEAKAEVKAQELHRLDFRMEGKSCPVCLLSIQNKLKSLNGVQDAAVMLKRPFGVSVIYESEKESSDNILTILKAKEPTIKIFEISDKKIDAAPVPLIPPFMPTPEPEPIKILPNDALNPGNSRL